MRSGRSCSAPLSASVGRQSERRWRDFARTAELASVFADFGPCAARGRAGGAADRPRRSAHARVGRGVRTRPRRLPGGRRAGRTFTPPARLRTRVRRHLERRAGCRAGRDEPLPGADRERPHRSWSRTSASARRRPPASSCAWLRRLQPGRCFRCPDAVDALVREQLLPVATRRGVRVLRGRANLGVDNPTVAPLQGGDPAADRHGPGLIHYRLRLHGVPMGWLTRIEL